MTRKKDVVADLVAKVERLRRASPTLADLIEHWVDRLIAGEPLEALQAEMDRVVATLCTPPKGRR